MAGSTRAALRRRQDAERARREQQVLVGVVAVLVLVAVIVLAGLYTTVYAPPRAHVALISDRDVTAEEAANRASHYMVFAGGAFSREIAGIADFTVDLLAREMILRKNAPALAGEVTDEDVTTKARQLLGNVQEGEAYSKALAAVLKQTGLSRDEYFDIVRAAVLSDRLRDQLRADVPTTVEQRQIQLVRTPSRTNAERVIERANAGEDMAKLAAQYGADRRLPVDSGWQPLDLLDADRRAAIEGLAAGAVSAPIPNGLYFDVYKVLEIDPSRELTDQQRDSLASRRVDSWVDEQKMHVRIERDISSSEAKWIETRVTARVTKAFQK